MDFIHIVRVAWFTFFQAACSTLMALLIGLPAAFFCGRRKFPGRKLLLSLSAVPVCVPTLIIALGYVTFLGLNGGLNQFLMFIFGLDEPPVRFLYSFFGLVIAHGFYNFPLIMKTVSDAWIRLPQQQAESARLLGAKESRIFRTITIHQLVPSIASSSIIVFIYCFLSFILVLLFGGIGNTTLEVEIYKAVRATLDFKAAGVLSLFETSILVLVTAVYCILEQKTSRIKGINLSGEKGLVKIHKPVEWIGFAVTMILIISFFVAPMLGIVFNAFTAAKTGNKIVLTSFARVISMRSFWPSVRTTVYTACCTGVVCMFTGLVYSVFLRFIEEKSKTGITVLLKIIPMISMSISSVVVGFIITLIVHRGNVACLIIAQSLLTWPLAYRQIYPHLNKISSQTMDCARLISKNKIDMLFRVIIPLVKKSLLSAFGFCFAVSAGDTTLPLVLAIPKFDTLSLFTYRLAGAYRFNEACAAGMILGVFCIIVFTVSTLIDR